MYTWRRLSLHFIRKPTGKIDREVPESVTKAIFHNALREQIKTEKNSLMWYFLILLDLHLYFLLHPARLQVSIGYCFFSIFYLDIRTTSRMHLSNQAASRISYRLIFSPKLAWIKAWRNFQNFGDQHKISVSSLYFYSIPNPFDKDNFR